MFELFQIMATKSPCYKKATPMTPTGIVVHSTGCNNPYLKRYVQPDDGNLGDNIYDNDVNREDHYVIAHAYIGKDKTGKVKCYQTLPFDMACWSAGGSTKGSYNYNPQGRIQFEICEDGLKNEAYFNEAFECAIDFCVYLCTKYNLKVENICSHKEGHKAGYASNHGDPENWMSKFDKDMDWFRESVKKKLDEQNKPKTEENVIHRVQVGAFSNIDYAKALAKELIAKGYNAFIISDKKTQEDKVEEPKEVVFNKLDKVRLQDNAPIYGSKKVFAPFVYEMDLYVRAIDGDAITISINAKGDITGVVDKKYLTKVSY